MTRKYCLSYDVNDVKKNDPELIKKKIIALILEQTITHTLSNPVASTIIFEDDNDERDISNWNSTFSKLNDKISYYLCEVPFDDSFKRFIDRNEGNPTLIKNFHKIVNEIIQEGLKSSL